MDTADVIEIPQTPYTYHKSQVQAIRDLAHEVQELRRGGRLSPDVLGHIRQYFHIKNVYHSNAIEGNTLDIGETRQVIELGLTITGKSLKDQAEAKNLSEALDSLEDLAKDTSQPIREVDIRQLHYLVLKQINDQYAGKYRNIQVAISGSEFSPPIPEQVPHEMKVLADWLTQSSVTTKAQIGSGRALLIAAVTHTWFVQIHPFVDGNGRVARLLMNLILMRFGYPIAIIAKEDRLRYYEALEHAQTRDLSAFVSLTTECVSESLEEYQKSAAQQQLAWATRFSEQERAHTQYEYEVWKNAMALLKSYFQQMATSRDESAPTETISFQEFGMLAFEKYFSLHQEGAAKRTWFFRIDLIKGAIVARYLFFFGIASEHLQDLTDVTLHLARENPPNSHSYDRLEQISAPHVPNLLEIGYLPQEEQFVWRGRSGAPSKAKMDLIGKRFFEDVIDKHFRMP